MKTKTKNGVHVPGPGTLVMPSVGEVKVQLAEKRRPKTEYPAASIGADLLRRDYIRYLTERYFRYREADASFGPKAVRRFSYAVLFQNIERHFQAPTYFIPVARFDELVDFLQRKIEATILSKRNRARGHRNYQTFDEFQLAQVGEEAFDSQFIR